MKIVRGLLSESTAKLIVNGEHTEPFQVERGVKQGDPLSPLLFTFAVELLARCANDKQMLNKFPYIGKTAISHWQLESHLRMVHFGGRANLQGGHSVAEVMLLHETVAGAVIGRNGPMTTPSPTPWDSRGQ